MNTTLAMATVLAIFCYEWMYNCVGAGPHHLYVVYIH